MVTVWNHLCGNEKLSMLNQGFYRYLQYIMLCYSVILLLYTLFVCVCMYVCVCVCVYVCVCVSVCVCMCGTN
jgi:hypothetical protein